MGFGAVLASGDHNELLPGELMDCVTEVRVEQRNITSKDHRNRLVAANKIAFSSFDDKRYLLCNLHSCPYGSVLIDRFLREKECPVCADDGFRLY